MKTVLRTLGCAMLCAMLLCQPSLAAQAQPETSAAAAVVMHVETGTVIYEQNADAQMRIASTTKIMTALVVLERCAPGEAVEILPEYTEVEGSSMYLRAGETYTVEELLYGLMLASGNDAARALACHVAGSEDAFAELMNAKARELGLTNTSFRNPHGLDADGHGSTARELGALACCAMQNETFREIVSTNCKDVHGQTYTNHNRLLRTYPGAIGVKTGYTEAAGRILVSCAERDGTQFVCVTISDPNDWDDHAHLLDWAFDTYAYRKLLSPETAYPLPVLSGEQAECAAVPAQAVALLLPKDAETLVQISLPRFAFAPVTVGMQLGSATVIVQGAEPVAVPLLAQTDVPLDAAVRLTTGERFSRLWSQCGRYLFSYYRK